MGVERVERATREDREDREKIEEKREKKGASRERMGSLMVMSAWAREVKTKHQVKDSSEGEEAKGQRECVRDAEQTQGREKDGQNDRANESKRKLLLLAGDRRRRLWRERKELGCCLSKRGKEQMDN